jgi:predicted amidohydrolase YtcJ
VVFRTGPDASLNSLALKLAGIDRHFKVPEGVPGKIEKDTQGEPTGVLRTFHNYVKLPDKARRAEATKEQRRQRLAQLLRDYRANGLTSVCDRDTSVEGMELYQELRARGELPVRVSLSRHINTLQPLSNVVAAIRQVAEEPLFRQRDDWLRIVAVKVYLDGGMLTGSAYLRQPWGVSDIYAITDPAYRGTLFIPLGQLTPMVRAAVEAGLQFTAHTVGDGAVHTLLDAYAAVNRDRPVRPARPCISHANFMSPEAVARLPELGVALDVQPAWLYLDTRTLFQHFGEQRLRWFQPLRSIVTSGGLAGGGSDHMQKIGADRSINPYNPFLSLATTVLRRAKWFEGQLHPEEALTRAQALRFYTANNAWLLFQERQLGSLEPGKLADFIVIDTDLLECPPEKIAGTRVLRTFLDGQPVFAR